MEPKQDRQLFAYLVEPTGEEKKRAVVKCVKGNESVNQVDLTTVKSKIGQLRNRSVAELPNLIKEFERRVSEEKQIDYTFAHSAVEAAKQIRDIAGNIKDIAVNDSSLVKELKLPLEGEGLRVIDTYFQQFGAYEGASKMGGQEELLPVTLYSSSWQSFSKPVPLHLADRSDNGTKKNIVAIVGVNAASAFEGTVFLLQHASNIQDLLGQAAKVIFVVGVEKLTYEKEDALFQVQCAGLFGFESRARNLAKGNYQTSDVSSVSEIDVADVAGPQQIHVILLDNGRLKLRESSFKDVLTCISCRACTHECPTHTFFGDQFQYPQAYLRGFLSERSSSLKMCVNCGTCQIHCPVGIDIPWLMMQAKEKTSKSIKKPGHYLVTNYELLGKSAHYLAPVINQVTKNKVVRSILDIVDIDKRQPMPTLVSQSFVLSRKNQAQLSTKKEVIYFPGCQVNFSEPELGDVVVKLLEMNGIGVKVPNWRCCQIPKLVYGDRERGFKAIEHNMEILGQVISEGKDVVVNCPSCLMALKTLYPKYSRDPQMTSLGDHILDIHGYLLSQQQAGTLTHSFTDVRTSVFYHIPCHTQAEGLSFATQSILELIPGLSVVDSYRKCCGMSGTWGTKKSNYDLSLKVGSPLFERIKASKADKVVTPCSACRMRISSFSPVEVTYPLMMLYEGLKDPH